MTEAKLVTPELVADASEQEDLLDFDRVWAEEGERGTLLQTQRSLSNTENTDEAEILRSEQYRRRSDVNPTASKQLVSRSVVTIK